MKNDCLYEPTFETNILARTIKTIIFFIQGNIRQFWCMIEDHRIEDIEARDSDSRWQLFLHPCFLSYTLIKAKSRINWSLVKLVMCVTHASGTIDMFQVVFN